jgi:ABC-type transport system involved in cytochrome bd biosynthesis fused ATPase/permease subunit
VNLETDLVDRKKLLDIQHVTSTTQRAQIRKQLRASSTPTDDVAVDLMSIQIKLGSVLITDWKGAVKIDFNIDVALKQGGIVVLTGAKGAGKATLMKLLASRYLPGNLQAHENIFVPGHCRVLSVQETPLFFRRGLYHNLIYGMKASSAAASKDRVMNVCKKLGIKERILAYLDQDEPEDWVETFSTAECKLLGIARALVNNFEITCFHKPLTGLTAEDRQNVVDTLKEHTVERGVCPSTKLQLNQKRMRTVFLTVPAVTNQLATLTQDIIKLDKDGSRQLTQEEHDSHLKDVDQGGKCNHTRY